MKYLPFVFAALVLALALTGPDNGRAADSEKVVVVDPADLKPPLENPEAELTEKYANKPVRFTGRLQAAGQDAAKKTWHDLATEVALGNGPKAARAKVIVRVYFGGDEKRVKALRAGAEVTVEGKGEVVAGDRPLLISDARLAEVKAPATRR